MVAPIPKTKAQELFLEVSEIEQKITFLTEFQKFTYLRRVDSLLKTGVDIGSLWITKGYIYSLSNQPREMKFAFDNAIALGATDSVDYFNYATQYLINGFYDEAAEGFAKSLDNDAQEALFRIAFSFFNFELIESLLTMPSWKEKLIERINDLKNLGIRLDKTQEVLRILIDCFQSRKVRFTLNKNEISQDFGLVLYYDVYASEELISEVLLDFDNKTSLPEYFEHACKLNIMLLQDLRFFKAQKLHS